MTGNGAHVDRRRVGFFPLTFVAGILVLTASRFTLADDESTTGRDSQRHQVTISDLKFVPEVLVLRSGDTVTFVNKDIVPHTATATGQSWDSGNLATGASYTIEVTERTVLSYYCVYHPMMTASFDLSALR